MQRPENTCLSCANWKDKASGMGWEYAVPARRPGYCHLHCYPTYFSGSCTQFKPAKTEAA